MAATGANIANLTKALADYCVPKCTSGCAGIFLANYVPNDPQDLSKGGICECPDKLTYDSDLRECIVKCPMGTYVYKGTGCPAGLYKGPNTVDEHGVMPEGTICPTTSYRIIIE
jgi:hypothetical protein